MSKNEVDQFGFWKSQLRLVPSRMKFLLWNEWTFCDERSRVTLLFKLDEKRLKDRNKNNEQLQERNFWRTWNPLKFFYLLWKKWSSANYLRFSILFIDRPEPVCTTIRVKQTAQPESRDSERTRSFCTRGQQSIVITNSSRKLDAEKLENRAKKFSSTLSEKKEKEKENWSAQGFFYEKMGRVVERHAMPLLICTRVMAKQCSHGTVRTSCITRWTADFLQLFRELSIPYRED